MGLKIVLHFFEPSQFCVLFPLFLRRDTSQLPSVFSDLFMERCPPSLPRSRTHNDEILVESRSILPLLGSNASPVIKLVRVFWY